VAGFRVSRVEVHVVDEALDGEADMLLEEESLDGLG